MSRLLRKAQDRGIVRITVTPPSGTYPELEDGLQERYGLKLALVVDTAPENERTMLGDLGAAAAYYCRRRCGRVTPWAFRRGAPVRRRRCRRRSRSPG
ncbi:hypothetical protein STRIP9103_09232 [Streptomyces ipomoeae 91-03]|uniref:Uncharacterized protein n=1 Tax=Streptomyces ipomoeae 91-03 TaxID=698759 RepID=L1KXI6_9ACTN|nr:hypothetical protein STRIP9103_09232 [Streptomyces ipomoeae 91-03]